MFRPRCASLTFLKGDWPAAAPLQHRETRGGRGVALRRPCILRGHTRFSNIPRGRAGLPYEEAPSRDVEAERGMLDAIARVLAPLYATFPKNASDKPSHVTVILVMHTLGVGRVEMRRGK